jgi:hypothetical protein
MNEISGRLKTGLPVRVLFRRRQGSGDKTKREMRGQKDETSRADF